MLHPVRYWVKWREQRSEDEDEKEKERSENDGMSGLCCRTMNVSDSVAM